LRSLIPTGPVNISSRTYQGNLGRVGQDLRPTPPPDVISRTKFLLQEGGKAAGPEEFILMYVTDVSGAGPFTICRGWLLRYPRVPHPVATTKWIIEPNVSYLCNRSALTPFVVPSASPRP
jgi:hypothetical protein